MGSTDKYNGIRPKKDGGKAENELHLADMHGDGVHFDRELLAKAKLKEQSDKDIEAQNKSKN
ncbi:hypothetical protein P700755_003698 [Psychroflexus torquis ATCC 700755]|uniref:YfhD family protein n=1 Tax=Psychroflexus torquis (strain ATCC 700755 / CIP 106069 / ACAM 623) TaxID=313595 RepID=K4II95_PSYTT|nr:hypothetical protein [Psychroflexus torquis]AFU70287.1 hypothetical protein P700755_003698 [Psychroflexus torquis ATCC 700755]